MSSLTQLNADFVMHLSVDKSPRTIATYKQSVCRFIAAIGDKDATDITRKDIDKFLVGLRVAGYRDTSISVWFRGIQQFWRWALEGGETKQNPMESYRQPKVAQHLVPIVELSVMTDILRETKGPNFRDKRDFAILMIFIETGARLSEIANLRTGDVDLNKRLLTVMGKGRKERQIPFNAQVAAAINAYLYARRKYPRTARLDQPVADCLWIAHRGAMTPSGIYQVIRDRSATANHQIHPHQLRHSFIHFNLVAGTSEGDIQHLVGWSSRQMFAIYGAAKQAERAQAHYRARTIIDRLDI